MPFRHGVVKTICIAVQLMALLLVQGYFLTPALLKLAKPAVAGKICSGNHQLCGCPPDRIANKTCCCFRTTHPCCHSSEETGATVGNDAHNGDVSLRTTPCGLFTDTGLLSLDNNEFIVAEPLPAQIASPALSIFAPFSGLREGRPGDPPDLPPHIDVTI